MRKLANNLRVPAIVWSFCLAISGCSTLFPIGPEALTVARLANPLPAQGPA